MIKPCIFPQVYLVYEDQNKQKMYLKNFGVVMSLKGI